MYHGLTALPLIRPLVIALFIGAWPVRCQDCLVCPGAIVDGACPSCPTGTTDKQGQCCPPTCTSCPAALVDGKCDKCPNGRSGDTGQCCLPQAPPDPPDTPEPTTEPVTSPAKGWKLEIATLLSDPNTWNSAFKTKAIYAVIVMVLMTQLRAALVTTLVAGVFVLGLAPSWQVIAAILLATYGNGKGDMLLTAVGVWAAWCYFNGYRLPIIG